MKKNARLAFNALKKIGAPVMEEPWSGGHFRLSGESGEDGPNGLPWADYYMEFGVNEEHFGVNADVMAILDKYGLYAEWCNPGVLDIYDA